MNTTKTLISGPIATNLSRAVARSCVAPTSTGLRASHPVWRDVYAVSATSQRAFSTTRPSRIEFFPPAKDAPNIKTTPAQFKHPAATEEQLHNIPLTHREARTWSDAAAYRMVQFFKWSTNFMTGYRNDPNDPVYRLNARKWFVRFIFLETIAAVPGMTAGMLRHFRSLRRMQRDHGWIETMLEDAYNERMHLLTFMKMAEPGPLMKFLVMGAQGVFANGFFLAYLISPATAHRFVGYLEEEAVKTYTQAIEDLDAGKIPEWNDLQAPEMAIQYWNMPENKRTMRDLLLYVRADEAKHREIHHTFGNLNQMEDPNPFVSEYKDSSKPHPSRGFENVNPQGWERSDVL